MNNQQEEIELLRDVNATLIPHGEEFILSKGEKITVTHKLGGNFTVMTLNGMYRIAAKDSDALGKDNTGTTLKDTHQNAEPATEENVKENLKSVFDHEIPVNVVDLGLIYKVVIENVQDRGRIAFVDLTLTAPGCGMGPVLMKNVEKSVTMLPNEDKVDVVMVFDTPWNAELMTEEAKLELGLF